MAPEKRAADNGAVVDEPKRKKFSAEPVQKENFPKKKDKSKQSKFEKTIKTAGVKVGNGKAFSKGFVPRTGKDSKSALKKVGKGDKAGATEKTDWRKFKQDKKDLKLKRKKSKDLYEISVEAKQIYEKLKCRRSENKSELVQKLYNLLGGDDIIKKLVMAHDTARIIQCMLKFASPALREELSMKLLPLVVDMSVSKYSHFCVLRMFKYGSPNIKSKLVDSFMGNIVRLAGHTISNKILDNVYLSVANPQQKIFMRQEFYGELYKNCKDSNAKALSDTFKDSPDMKASILGSVKSNLEHIANKKLVDNSLVHAVMLEYLHQCDEEKIEEIITAFSSLIPMMLSTEDGCQAAIICFYKSTPKNRRAIIKTIKEHLVKICTHEQGHVFIIALLNSLDDTKATKKAIYDTIHPELKILMENQWGRRVIQWFVSPADTNCFHPNFIANIEKGLNYGKKDKDVRRKEIFEQIEEPITGAIVEQPELWLSNKHIGLVTADILKKITSMNFIKACNALVPIITNPEWTVELEETKEKTKTAHDVEKIIAEATQLRKQKQKTSKEASAVDKSTKDTTENEPTISAVSGIEEVGMHVVLKKIIRNDKERLVLDDTSETFGSTLVQHLTNETLEYWLKVNRACFILLNIAENNTASTKEVLKELLRPHLNILKQHPTSGSKLLLANLEL